MAVVAVVVIRDGETRITTSRQATSWSLIDPPAGPPPCRKSAAAVPCRAVPRRAALSGIRRDGCDLIAGPSPQSVSSATPLPPHLPTPPPQRVDTGERNHGRRHTNIV